MKPSYSEIREEIRSSIMEKIDFSREVPDSEVLDLIDRRLTEGGKAELFLLTLEDRKRLRQDLFHSIRRMDVLQDLLEDPEVTEILVNGPDHIFVEKAGRLSRYPGCFSSPEKLEDVIQLLFIKRYTIIPLTIISSQTLYLSAKPLMSLIFLYLCNIILYR